MSKFRFDISISLDGYVAGPDQSEEEPLGEGGEELHDWVFELEAWRKSHGTEGGEVNASTPVMEEQLENVGASLMGRNMFGPPAVVTGATVPGTAGGATTRRSTCRSSCSPTTSASRSTLYGHHLQLRHRRDRVRARAGAGGGRRQGRPDRRRREHVKQYLAAGLIDELRAARRPAAARRRGAAARGCRATWSSSRSVRSRRPASPTSSTASSK